MKIIGLTGGIGSGKSSVLEIFKKIGISTYNADESAKKLISSDKGSENPVSSGLSKNVCP